MIYRSAALLFSVFSEVILKLHVCVQTTRCSGGMPDGILRSTNLNQNLCESNQS